MENQINYCPNCGQKLGENQNFCPNCGKALHAQSINETTNQEINVNVEGGQNSFASGVSNGFGAGCGCLLFIGISLLILTIIIFATIK